MSRDFFEAIPPGGDLYILKTVLHDWSDDEAAQILRTIRRAVPAGTRLLIITILVTEKGLDLEPIYMDLLMLAVFGGKERTLQQFETLLTETEFKLRRCKSLVGSHHFIKAEAV